MSTAEQIPGQTDLVDTLAAIDEAVRTYDFYRTFGYGDFLAEGYALDRHREVARVELRRALSERSRSSRRVLSPSKLPRK